MRTNKTIENKIAAMSVAQLRKVAPQYGIKNASKYKRAQLSELLYNAMTKQEEAKQIKANKSTKRFKATKVSNDQTEQLANEILKGIENLTDQDMLEVNRKVLNQVMKMLPYSK